MEAQARQDRNQEREHDRGVPAHADQHLAEKERRRDLGDDDSEQAERREEDGDDVPERGLAQGQVLPTRVSA